MTPYLLDFGQAPVGHRSRQLVTIRNVGYTDLVIAANSFEVVDQPGGAVSPHWFIETATGAPVPAQQVVLSPGAQHTLWLRFEPVISGRLNGYVLLNNNDPSRSTFLIVLNATAI